MKDWTKHTDKDDFKVYYRHDKGDKNLTLYLEGLINAPLINLFSILAEVQLFKDWIPLNKQSDIIGEVSHLKKAAYFRFGLPWPFASREILVQACGLILKEERACCLTLSSIEGDSWLG